MARMTTQEAYEQYDNDLDESYGTVSVAGYNYETSRALLELDPIAYRCGFNDWADAMGIDTDRLKGDLYRHH